MSSLLNHAINALPFELHIPVYQFCGETGMHLEKRLTRGDRGINPLDAACREFDIAYSRNNDLVADNIQTIYSILVLLSSHRFERWRLRARSDRL